MGKSGGIKKAENGTKGGSANIKAKLKHEHLRNLAVWASSDASIPSLASFFGHRLAADGEAAAIPPDPSLFPCQRCETILQPGFNCTVRIEKNRGKARRRYKKPHLLTQNSVAYNCHFCSYRNLKRGTPKGHMKEMYPPKLKAFSIPKAVKATLEKSVTSSGKDTRKDELDKVDVINSPPTTKDSIADGPVTPLSKGRTLLDGTKRNRNKSGSKQRLAEPENNTMTLDAEKTIGTSSKRRRKSWMSLREIVESS